MPITRKWLPWDRPALLGAVDELLLAFRQNDSWDMTNVVVVVPGGRAKRRLLELLVDHAADEKLLLIPPSIRTIGSLPELLYEPRFPFADLLTQQLAWAQALRDTREHLGPVFARLPSSDAHADWLELGDMLRREHAELAADYHDFSDVAGLTQYVAPDEVPRWQTLYKVQQRFWQILDQLQIWDKQKARIEAIKRKECRCESQLILVGAVDLNKVQKLLLDEVAEHVTAYVHAPPEWRSRFDEHGCLKADAWRDAHLNVPDERIHLAAGPDEQADALLHCLASWQGKYRADEITVGFPSESLVPEVERKLRQLGLPARWGPGKPVEQSGPFRLGDALRDYVHRGDFASFAALARHPDLHVWLAQSGDTGDWLSSLDEYHNEHLPTRWDGNWLGAADRRAALESVYQHLEKLLLPLRGRPRSFADWAVVWRDVVLTLYGTRELDPAAEAERTTLVACRELLGALEILTTVPERLRYTTSAEEALSIAQSLAAGTLIPAADEQAAIELVGWLELSLDDAPALVVIGLNDGAVPEAVNSDPFLPNTLRTALEINDNARRYARDAYALSVLLATRPDAHIIVGRVDSEGNPLAPSRLLFACEPEQIAQRMLKWCEEAEPTVRRPFAGEFVPARSKSAFEPPHPDSFVPRCLKKRPSQSLELRVTDFKSYLECPYRFLLGRLLYLQPLDDSAEELDGGTFGTLAHEVLREFASGPQRDSSDPDTVRADLDDRLQTEVAARYGAHPRPAVLVQVEQLRRRLSAFADRQAARAAKGWRIFYAEDPKKPQRTTLDLDGQPFTLIGRIDRIDWHEKEKRFEIFDYKTGDSGKSPEETHRKKDEWIDFQLPLYRHLAYPLGVQGDVGLGYIVLPKDVSQVEFLLASWSEEELQEADESAWELARAIRAEQFHPMTTVTKYNDDPFARICQTGVLR